ncbi:hypothetical protein [Deinococcus depolymerans]|uniref:hypothetical protein n=1 Tax=Deinococcus depolymerans TaxID=392408 RepID=UPI0031DFC476
MLPVFGFRFDTLAQTSDDSDSYTKNRDAHILVCLFLISICALVFLPAVFLLNSAVAINVFLTCICSVSLSLVNLATAKLVYFQNQKTIDIIRIGNPIFVVISQILVTGYADLHQSLLIAFVLSQIIISVTILNKDIRESLSNIHPSYTYIDSNKAFIFKAVPAGIVNSIGLYAFTAMIPLFSSQYQNTILFAQRITQGPASSLTMTLSQILTMNSKQKKVYMPIIRDHFILSLGISIFYVLGLIFAVSFIENSRSKNWTGLTEFSIIFLAISTAQMIVSPTSIVVLKLRKLVFQASWDYSRAVAILIYILVCLYLNLSIQSVVIGYAIVMVMFYLIYAVMSFKFWR